MKFYSFAVVCAWIFGTIGCIGSLLYAGKPQFAVASALLSAMSFPYMKNHLDNLLVK